jgi:hypothetical protein
MPYKREPSTVAILSNFLDNLPRRLGGNPISRPHDPEICGSIYEGYIDAAFNYVASLNTDILILGGECSKLATCLAGKTTSSLYITCANCTGAKNSSSSAGKIQLCLSAYGLTLSQSTANGLVFRELIRMCGGMELDAWGLDSYFTYVNPGPPASFLPVPPVVKDAMCAGSMPGTGVFTGFRFGTFLAWYPPTGQLYAKQVTPTFGYHTPAIIASSTTAWQHKC